MDKEDECDNFFFGDDFFWGGEKMFWKFLEIFFGENLKKKKLEKIQKLLKPQI
jgi:hypothetical protein